MRHTSGTRTAQGARPRRPFAIVAITAVTCGCAVAVAHGQVSVPGVQTPQVNAPQLQDLPEVPSVPQTPSVPKVQVPSVPKTPSVQVPSVQVPSVGGGEGVRTPSVNVPSVKLPSNGAQGGGSTGSGTPAGARGGTGAAAGSAAAGKAGAGASAAGSRAHAARVHLTPKQRSARHERRLRSAARQLEGCLGALPSFDRKVIVLRGGLHGRKPLSRTKTAERLGVGSGRIRSAERSGLAGLEQADAQQGCGLRSGAGRKVAAERLANGSSPALNPLPVAGESPELVDTSTLSKDRNEVLGDRASSSDGATGAAHKAPRRASILPAAGDDGSNLPAAMLVALITALGLAGAAFLLLRQRRAAADPYGYGQAPPVYPYAWDADQSEQWEYPAGDGADEARADDAEPVWADTWVVDTMADKYTDAGEHTDAASDVQSTRRRDRVAQAVGGLAAAGAAITLVLGRFMGRRRR